MNPAARSVSYLGDMLEYARYAAEFTAGCSVEEFSQDRQKQFAVLRALEIVGEAAKSIPPEIRLLASNIPWRQITAMRDKLTHHYFGVDIDVVWQTVTKDIPHLIIELDVLVAKVRADGSEG